MSATGPGACSRRRLSASSSARTTGWTVLPQAPLSNRSHRLPSFDLSEPLRSTPHLRRSGTQEEKSTKYALIVWIVSSFQPGQGSLSPSHAAKLHSLYCMKPLSQVFTVTRFVTPVVRVGRRNLYLGHHRALIAAYLLKVHQYRSIPFAAYTPLPVLPEVRL